MAAVSASMGSFQRGMTELPKIDSEKLKKSLKSFPFLSLKDHDSPSGTATLKDARIIFLGESDHSDKTQNSVQQKFIDTISKDGDIVLVEGRQAFGLQDSSTFPTTSSVKKKIIVYGWDNYELWKQNISDLENLAKIYEIMKKLQKESSITNMSLFLKMSLKAVDLLNKSNAIFDERDKSLINTVKACLSNLKPMQRIFVLGGKKHFGPNMHHFKSEKYFQLDFANKHIDGEEYLKFARGAIRGEFKSDSKDEKGESSDKV
jgi:hypothetical protein